jgi:thiol-disulfide isomerase/thioredoxin
MDFAAQFAKGLAYTPFLDKYANEEQRRRWDAFHGDVRLTSEQKVLLRSFVREMHVLVLAGAWCGDCINQCPIWDHFAAETDRIVIRYLDRDDNPELAAELSVCGGQRVPAVVFLSEDDQSCGRYGDRTLSKYRQVASELQGAACPTGLATPASLTASVIQDWLDEFERIQLILRTSARLRKLHND